MPQKGSLAIAAVVVSREVPDKNTADDSLSIKEQGLLEQCRKDRKEHPENLTPWANVRREKSMKPQNTVRKG